MKQPVAEMDAATLAEEQKRMKSRMILMIAEGLLSLLVILLFCNMAFGWFSENKQVDGRGPHIDAEAFDARADYVVYVYDSKDSDVHYTGQTVDKNGAAITFTPPTINTLDMQFHDTIFVQRNRYTPAVVRIHLSDIREDHRSGGTVSVTLERDTAIPQYASEGGAPQLNEYFTSVMRFTLAQDKTWLDDQNFTNGILNTYYNLDEALYTQVVVNKEFSPASSSAVFTTVTEGAGGLSIAKADSVTVSIPYQASAVVNGEMDLYLYVTYDTDLVHQFEQEAGIDTSDTSVGKITTMVSDLTRLTVSFS